MEEVYPVYLMTAWHETTVHSKIGMPDGTLTEWLGSKEMALRVAEVLFATGSISEEAFAFLKDEIASSPLPHDPTIKPLGFVFVPSGALDELREEAFSEKGPEDEYDTEWLC